MGKIETYDRCSTCKGTGQIASAKCSVCAAPIRQVYVRLIVPGQQGEEWYRGWQCVNGSCSHYRDITDLEPEKITGINFSDLTCKRCGREVKWVTQEIKSRNIYGTVWSGRTCPTRGCPNNLLEQAIAKEQGNG